MSKDELLAALEAATGPSRELDAEIGALLPPPPKDNGAVVWWPYYTASIDAALSLVEKGAEYAISTLYGIAQVEMPLNMEEPHIVRRDDGNVPLAICAAALKARP